MYLVLSFQNCCVFYTYFMFPHCFLKLAMFLSCIHFFFLSFRFSSYKKYVFIHSVALKFIGVFMYLVDFLDMLLNLKQLSSKKSKIDIIYHFMALINLIFFVVECF